MGFARALVSSTRYEMPGTGSTAGGIEVSSTLGAYGTLTTIGTTGFDYDGFYLNIKGFSGPNPRVRIVLTANVGGAGDEPLIQDYFIDASNNGFWTQATPFFPVSVPKGAVLKAQLWAAGSGGGFYLAVIGVQGDAKMTRGFRGVASATDFAAPAPAAPTLSSVAGGTLAAATYYTKVTYISSTGGESAVSTETSLAVALDNLLVVTSPASASGQVSYNVYVSTATGTETLQNASPVTLGTNWTEPTTGLVSGRALPSQTTADPANTITFSGTTTTGWVQAQASTPQRLAGLYVCADSVGNSPALAFVRWDLGVGAAGSEQLLLSVFSQLNGLVWVGVPTVFPCDIPAGSRLAYRATASGADTSTMALVLCGLIA